MSAASPGTPPMVTARSTRARGPHVRAGLLHGVGAAPVLVGSPEWFGWVCSPVPAAVRMEDTDPAFTARRERRGGGGYWYGYHRSGGSLRKVYLGRGAELTAERLHAAADELARAAGPGYVPRRDATAEVRRLLRAHRLVTLVGIGGIGKSSLAGEVVAGVDPDPGSRWVVELASIADATVVAEVVRAGLGLPARPGRSAVESIRDLLGGARRLLMLDNCEHLAGAAASLVTDLLAACPGVTVIATSRVALGVAGELVWEVPSLTVPAADANAAAVLGAEAGRLFRARARAVEPCFTVSDAVAGPVAQVCRAVDGIPLAVELAASRLRVFSVGELACRLDDVFAALGDGPDPRQRTLRATLDWSHEHLDERERALLARLSVFADSWSLALAEAVCAGGVLETGAVGAVLAGLVERSLVQALPGTVAGDRRFRLLGPVRRYAAERLRERGEFDAVRDRHATEMVALAERTGPLAWFARHSDLHQRFDLHQDDLWAAWQRLVARDDLDEALRIGGVLPLFWIHSVGVHEGRRRLTGLLDLADERGTPAQAGALVAAAVLASSVADRAATGPLLTRALPLARRSGDVAVEGAAVFLIAAVRWPGAWDELRDGAVAAESAGLPGVAGLILGIQALLGLASGLPAGEIAARGLARSEEAGYPLGSGFSAAALALVALHDGDLTRARAFVATCLAATDYVGGGPAMLRGLTFGCWIELAAGDVAAARQRAVAAVTLVRQRLSDSQLMGPLEGLAQVAAARGQWQRALRLAGAAAELRERFRVRAAAYEREQLERWTSRAEAALGPAAAASASAAGRALPLDAAVAEALRSGEDTPAPGRLPPLTDRQSEVARLVAAGLSNAQVAARLHLSGSTVARHLASSYQAVGVCSRTQLAAWVSSQSPVPGPG